MSIAARIRVELLLCGPLTVAELAKRMECEADKLHCHVNQLRKRKKDAVIKVGRKYGLKRLHCPLAEVWK